MGQQNRREFLGTVGISVGAIACSKRSNLSSSVAGAAAASSSSPPTSVTLPSGGVMPMRTLGRTGEKVSLIGLGGFHIGVPKEEQESIRIVRSAIDHGVNFMDNCWDYHDGKSEELMGKALRDGYRKRIFLMTKIDGRTKESAAKQIEDSLRRLQTDIIDLVQLHEIIRMEDPDRIFAPKGAIEAVVAAKKEGKIRYIGFTGHKDPDIHLHMLKTAFAHKFTFDTVQMPLNVMDPHYKSFQEKVLPVLIEHNIGVLGMKPLGSGIILKSNAATATECLHYSMNLPTSVVITGCDSLPILDQALRAAYTFQPLSQSQVDALLARTAEAGSNGQYELFKTATQFDGTTKHPEWLG